jgi:hypothetical protein
MAALSDAAAGLWEYLPATYGTDRDDGDPIVARWLEALAVELGRIGAVLEAVRSTTIPSRADDTVGSLRRWEAVQQIPVAPSVSLAQRRAQVLAALLGRRVAYGRDWTTAMTSAVGSADWQAFEHTPGPNQLTIQIPFTAGSYQAVRVAEIARRHTPANQQIIMDFAGVFIVGSSDVGDDL